MDDIQTDVLEDILVSLPIESALQSKQVCKTWRDLIKKNTKVGLLFAFANVWDGRNIRFYYSEHPFHPETDFVQLHLVTLRTSIPAYHDLMIGYLMVGSCNGLVCLAARPDKARHDPAIICNPVTGKYSNLPICSTGSKEVDYVVVAGFGYVHSTNQYKVVRICFKKSDMVPHVLVYTLGSPLGWREIANVPSSMFCVNSGVFANGLLHWVNEKKNNGTGTGERKECSIVSFDLGDECFYPAVPSPPFDYSSYTRSKLSLLLGGNLCLHLWTDKCIDIWSFKSGAASTYQANGQQRCYYDNTWSWCKDFSIECDKPLAHQESAITDINEVLLWSSRDRSLYSYDSKTSTSRKFWGSNRGTYIPAIPHVNSLISVEIPENGQMNH